MTEYRINDASLLYIQYDIDVSVYIYKYIKAFFSAQILSLSVGGASADVHPAGSYPGGMIPKGASKIA